MSHLTATIADESSELTEHQVDNGNAECRFPTLPAILWRLVEPSTISSWMQGRPAGESERAMTNNCWKECMLCEITWVEADVWHLDPSETINAKVANRVLSLRRSERPT